MATKGLQGQYGMSDFCCKEWEMLLRVIYQIERLTSDCKKPIIYYKIYGERNAIDIESPLVFMLGIDSSWRVYILCCRFVCLHVIMLFTACKC